MLKFNTIHKEPKDKIQIVEVKSGTIKGYLDFQYLVSGPRYVLVPAFEAKFTQEELAEITETLKVINS